jgi:uncharacterized protein
MADEKATPKTVAPGEKCPICGAPSAAKNRPFCSQRCANVDLNRWLSGSYAIPVVEDEDEDGGLPFDDEPKGRA